jgi:ParB family transcriptional regulator, chromosome partitioning protein
MTRKPLGRGLSALLSAEGATAVAEETNEVSIDLIDAGSSQPRTVFDDASLNELAKSIAANGVVQPILLRPKGGRFELIAGERRWRAAALAGLSKIPALVRNIQDDKVLEIALIENIQREDLNPIEEARAYRKLTDTLGLTQETIAEKVGRDRSYVTNYLRLLKLPEDIQSLLQSGRISTGHARTLLGVDQPDLQRRIARKIIDQDLSVRSTERLVRSSGRSSAQGVAVDPVARQADANTRAAETKLRRQLGTKVRILPARAGSPGKIELEFYNDIDLCRLFDLLMSEQAL